MAHAAEIVKHLFLRLFAHRAGVEQDHVGVFRRVGFHQTFRQIEHVGHLSESYSFIWQPKVLM